MERFTNKRLERIAVAYISGAKTVTELMREVYGKENCSHIYSLIARGAKIYYQKRGE